MTDSSKPSRTEAEAAARTLVRWCGWNPEDPRVRDTPSRLVQLLAECTEGEGANAADSLSQRTTNDLDYEQPVIMRGIAVLSLCEHHLAPIVGTATVAYIPHRTIVGLSKIARLVEVFARRLQSQERLTCEIGKAIEQELAPRGVGVIVRAVHHCMVVRGIRQPGIDTVTSYYAGSLTPADLSRALKDG